MINLLFNRLFELCVKLLRKDDLHLLCEIFLKLVHGAQEHKQVFVYSLVPWLNVDHYAGNRADKIYQLRCSVSREGEATSLMSLD
jgi:hypothetical protein